MASVTDFCNVALSHIGADATVVSISPPDGSVEAGYCARFYPIARRELIEAHSWAFAKTRATLAEVANPSTVWEYAYALPSDCIKVLRVLTQADLDAFLLLDSVETKWTMFDSVDEHAAAPFEVEEGVILTNEPEAVLIYRRDVTDTSKYPPLFGTALGYTLAGFLAGPIIKGLDGAKVGASLREQGFGMLAKAAASDANANTENFVWVPGQFRARA